MHIEWRKLANWYAALLKNFHPILPGYAGYSSNYYVTNRITPAILLALKGFLNIIEVQYSKKVKVIKCNNKITTTHPQVYAKIVQQEI
ncbi:unnamed protein product [Fusarium fujikuroi]|nr:unnamed protein product [Fusarium fujikuroi]